MFFVFSGGGLGGGGGGAPPPPHRQVPSKTCTGRELRLSFTISTPRCISASLHALPLLTRSMSRMMGQFHVEKGFPVISPVSLIIRTKKDSSIPLYAARFIHATRSSRTSRLLRKMGECGSAIPTRCHVNVCVCVCLRASWCVAWMMCTGSQSRVPHHAHKEGLIHPLVRRGLYPLEPDLAIAAKRYGCIRRQCVMCVHSVYDV